MKEDDHQPRCIGLPMKLKAPRGFLGHQARLAEPKTEIIERTVAQNQPAGTFTCEASAQEGTSVGTITRFQRQTSA